MANRSAAGDQDDQKQQQQQQAKEKEEEMRNNLLSAVLTQEARARLATIAAAKPDRAKMVENIIIQNTRMGMIRGKVDEDSLKDLLEKVTSQTKRETKVSYERRRVFDDSDEDDDD
jgi:programmed cell death protein 5